MEESIVLVPGLFGFSRIGDIDYFASVAPILKERTGIEPEPIPWTPPTGPLWRRVDHLYERVLEELKNGRTRVHIVGHSTGGVDARLLVDSRYLWPGGPVGDRRVEFFDRIGKVISLSGPHKGTPIARRLRGALEGVIPLVFLASFLAKYDAQSANGDGSVRRAMHRMELYRRVAEALAERPARPYSAEDAAGTPGDTSRQLVRFLDEIVEDHPLIHELTPYAMNRLNRHLARTTAASRVRAVSYFVSVAPPPSQHLLEGIVDPLRHGIYVGSYEETRLKPDEFGPLPEARWIGDPPRFVEFAHTAQDGVVPAASQTIDQDHPDDLEGGRVESYVFGDHLDVVGHYPTKKHGGETVFDSGADFSDERLEALWQAIGAVIRP